MDVGGHSILQEAQYDLARRSGFDVTLADGRRRIDDHHIQPFARRLERGLVGQVFRLPVIADKLVERGPCILGSELAREGNSDRRDRTGLNESFDLRGAGGGEQIFCAA